MGLGCDWTLSASKGGKTIDLKTVVDALSINTTTFPPANPDFPAKKEELQI